MTEPFNMDKVKEILEKVEVNWEAVATEWCSCNMRGDGSYDLHVPPNETCPLCKASIDNDHYHCGVCSKVTQVG